MRIYGSKRYGDTDLDFFKYIAGKGMYVFADILGRDGWTSYWVKIYDVDGRYIRVNFFDYPEDDYFDLSYIPVGNIRVSDWDELEIKTWQELMDMYQELQNAQYGDEGNDGTDL